MSGAFRGRKALLQTRMWKTCLMVLPHFIPKCVLCHRCLTTCAAPCRHAQDVPDGAVAPHFERHDEGEGPHCTPGALPARRRRAHRRACTGLLPRAQPQGLQGMQHCLLLPCHLMTPSDWQKARFAAASSIVHVEAEFVIAQLLPCGTHHS